MSELKFKVGDRVRIKNYGCGFDGQEGTVVRVRQTATFPYRVDGPFKDSDDDTTASLNHLLETELELVESKYKAGDKVRILHTDYPNIHKVGDIAEVVDADWECIHLKSAAYPDGLCFYVEEVEPVEAPKVTPKPTLATAVGLQPQTRKILNHLEKRGSISPMEALTAYGCFRLAAQVHNLRKAGFDVQTDLKEDEAGHRYARYRLAA